MFPRQVVYTKKKNLKGIKKKLKNLLNAKTSWLVRAYRYGESLPCVFNEKETIYYRTNRFMVFRQEEASKDGVRNMYYTEDIGDLSIFIGDNEPFCVQASSCPGLKPNSIYFMGYDFGVHDLATKTVHRFSDKGLPGPVFACPYWIPPVFL